MTSNKKTKIILRIIGFTLLIGGLTLTVIGFCNMGNFDSNLFSLSFIGIPCVAFGIGLTFFSFTQNISRYVNSEFAPVMNELAQNISPAVQTYAASVKEGLDDDTKITCACGAVNNDNAKFCANCGKTLQITCTSCGKVHSANDKFCPECGTKVE